MIPLFIPSRAGYAAEKEDFHKTQIKPMLYHLHFFSFQKRKGEKTETIIVNAPDKEKALEAIAFDLSPEDKKTLSQPTAGEIITGLEEGTVSRFIVIKKIEEGQTLETKDLFTLHKDNKTALHLFFCCEAQDKEYDPRNPYSISSLAQLTAAKRVDGMAIYTRLKDFVPAPK